MALILNLVELLSKWSFAIWHWFRTVIYSRLNFLLPSIFRRYKVHNPSPINAVLITGCSSGLGRALAIHLATNGYTVFASVRKVEDGERLVAFYRSIGVFGGQIVPVLLDITSDHSVSNAYESVESGCRQNNCDLIAVINNAGIAEAISSENVGLSQVKRLLDTNFLGAIRVSCRFLPLLRKTSGRIIFVGSGAAPTPMGGVYCASKKALESWVDNLRFEIGFSIPVSLIKPGAMSSMSFEKSLHGIREFESSRLLTQTSAMMTLFQKAGISSLLSVMAIEHAIISEFPQAKYHAGLDSWICCHVRHFVPGFIYDWIQLNVVTMIEKMYKKGLF